MAKARTMESMASLQGKAVEEDLYLQIRANYAVDEAIGAVNVQSGH